MTDLVPMTPQRILAVPAFAVALLFLATLAVFWNGIGPIDASRYIAAALDWTQKGPSLGDNHWALRLPIVAPIAASFALFGPGEFVSTLPNILYAAGLVAVTFHFSRRRLGDAGAIGCAGVIAASSFFVVAQSELSVVGPEIFFEALSCWLFLDAARANMDMRRLAASGLCAGAAWLCRETAVALPAALGLLLLARRPFSVKPLLVFGAGFGLIILAELAAYAIVAGDPLYRLKTDFGHRGAGKFYALPPGAPQNEIVARLTLPFRFLLTAPAVTPFVLLSGVLWLAPAFRRAALSPRWRDATLVFGTAAGASFLFSVFGANLRWPDYYPLLSYAALLSLGAVAAGVYDAGRRRLGAAIFASVIALNWTASDLRAYDELSEPRHLARFALSSGETATTDHTTALRARLYLRMAGLAPQEAATRIVSTLGLDHPPCGLVYVATPRGATRAIAPTPDWREIWTAEVRRKRWTVGVVTALSPGGSLPPHLKKLFRAAGPVALYEAPPCRP
ncbi:MAG: ArnT family glycosyltransferase [Pseudomonadota bacterium]